MSIESIPLKNNSANEKKQDLENQSILSKLKESKIGKAAGLAVLGTGMLIGESEYSDNSHQIDSVPIDKNKIEVPAINNSQENKANTLVLDFKQQSLEKDNQDILRLKKEIDTLLNPDNSENKIKDNSPLLEEHEKQKDDRKNMIEMKLTPEKATTLLSDLLIEMNNIDSLNVKAGRKSMFVSTDATGEGYLLGYDEDSLIQVPQYKGGNPVVNVNNNQIIKNSYGVNFYEDIKEKKIFNASLKRTDPAGTETRIMFNKQMGIGGLTLLKINKKHAVEGFRQITAKEYEENGWGIAGDLKLEEKPITPYWVDDKYNPEEVADILDGFFSKFKDSNEDSSKSGENLTVEHLK